MRPQGYRHCPESGKHLNYISPGVWWHKGAKMCEKSAVSGQMPLKKFWGSGVVVDRCRIQFCIDLVQFEPPKKFCGANLRKRWFSRSLKSFLS